jgi:hypothetical protein
MPHKVRMDEYLEINRRNRDERAAIHTRDTMRSASEYLATASEFVAVAAYSIVGAARRGGASLGKSCLAEAVDIDLS